MSFETADSGQSASIPAESAEQTLNIFKTDESAEQVEQADKPVEPVKPAVDEKLSAKFAALSRKEKQLKQQESQWRQQQQSLSQQMSELKSENEKMKREYEEYRKNIKTSPLQAMEKEGYSFEQLTEMQMNNQNPTPEMLIKQMRSELESGYKSELEALKQQIASEKQQQQEAAETQTVTHYKSQINEQVASNPDKYELISLNEASDLVFQVATEFYESEGRILSAEEAADFTEKYLEEEAKKVLNAKKFKAQQFKPKSDLPSSKGPTLQKEKSQTLSNDLSTEVPVSTSRKLTRDEEIEAAAKLLRWES